MEWVLSCIAHLRGGSRIEVVAWLLLGTDSHIYRVFLDHLEILHYKFTHFMAKFFMVV